MSLILELWNDRPRLYWREMMIGVALMAFMSVVFQTLLPIDRPELYLFSGIAVLALIRSFEKQR